MRKEDSPHILVVDDDAGIRDLLSSILIDRGYQIRPASNGHMALSSVASEAPDLIILDVEMPGMNGYEVCHRLKSDERSRGIPVIFCSGLEDSVDKVKGFKAGGVDYITQPFQMAEVLSRVQTHLDLRRMQKRLEDMVEERTAELRIANEQLQQDIIDKKHAEEELKRSFELLRKALGAIIQAMVVVVETRDPYTAGHQRRVSSLARAIAAEMDLPSETVDGIRMAGIIHDIGKIAVPAEILSKPTKLSEIEFSMIKIHPQAGYDILKEIEFPWPVAKIVLQHHEKIDGSGYPQGLRGDDILLEAKILSIADVVEAIASHRPYRPALGIEKALEEISRKRGILYDPEGVDACLRLFNEKSYKMQE